MKLKMRRILYIRKYKLLKDLGKEIWGTLLLKHSTPFLWAKSRKVRSFSKVCNHILQSYERENIFDFHGQYKALRMFGKNKPVGRHLRAWEDLLNYKKIQKGWLHKNIIKYRNQMLWWDTNYNKLRRKRKRQIAKAVAREQKRLDASKPQTSIVGSLRLNEVARRNVMRRFPKLRIRYPEAYKSFYLQQKNNNFWSGYLSIFSTFSYYFNNHMLSKIKKKQKVQNRRRKRRLGSYLRLRHRVFLITLKAAQYFRVNYGRGIVRNWKSILDKKAVKTPKHKTKFLFSLYRDFLKKACLKKRSKGVEPVIPSVKWSDFINEYIRAKRKNKAFPKPKLTLYPAHYKVIFKLKNFMNKTIKQKKYAVPLDLRLQWWLDQFKTSRSRSYLSGALDPKYVIKQKSLKSMNLIKDVMLNKYTLQMNEVLDKVSLGLTGSVDLWNKQNIVRHAIYNFLQNQNLVKIVLLLKCLKQSKFAFVRTHDNVYYFSNSSDRLYVLHDYALPVSEPIFPLAQWYVLAPPYTIVKSLNTLKRQRYYAKYNTRTRTKKLLALKYNTARLRLGDYEENGRVPSLPGEQFRRAKKPYRLLMFDRLRSYYGIFDLRGFNPQYYGLFKQFASGHKLYQVLECRVIFLLYLFNLFPTMYFIHQFVLHKNVMVYNNGVGEVVKSPHKLLELGGILQIPRYHYWSCLNTLLFRIKHWRLVLNVPRYLEVSYVTLSMLLISYPQRSELTKPFGTYNVSLQSLHKICWQDVS